MAKREVANRYVGSLLGFFWEFIHPVVMILVFWIVFSIGFKSQPMSDTPFVIWLAAGMAPWFVFVDIITGSAGIIVSNSHLIKKTLFPSQILPLVRIVSSLITHSVFLVVLLGLIAFKQLAFSFYFFQFFYYLLCMCVLSLGLAWALSSLNVFMRDINQMTAIIVQIGFWATPIFWDIHILPPRLQLIFKLNPMFYIVQGYRDSFISFTPFWERPYQTIYFWVVALVILGFGTLMFMTLKPKFADVL